MTGAAAEGRAAADDSIDKGRRTDEATEGPMDDGQTERGARRSLPLSPFVAVVAPGTLARRKPDRIKFCSTY